MNVYSPAFQSCWTIKRQGMPSGKRNNLGIVSLASSALYTGIPSGKSDSLGMVRSVPCEQAIPGMLQAKLGLPTLPTCLVLTEKGNI